MKRFKQITTMLLASMLIAGCSSNNDPKSINQANTIRRAGNSQDTLVTPEDFPQEYDYGSGKMSRWNSSNANKKLPVPQNDETVLKTQPNTTKIQSFYLWEEGKMPAVTKFTSHMTGYFDSYDFRPYVTSIPVRQGIDVKGAVILLAGGAFQTRGNYTDTLPTAAHLRELGFQTFIVDYRLRPYSQEEGALDVARAVRFIRKNADIYNIDPDNIAVMGCSAGGIQAGEFFLNYDEDVNGSQLDSRYVPDELDAITAHASACGMIYSFYGRLSVASLDENNLKKGNLPPTFYCYGTEDPFYDQFEKQYDLMQKIGISTKRIVLEDWPHGFGGDGGWIKDYAKWLENIFSSTDGKNDNL